MLQPPGANRTRKTRKRVVKETPEEIVRRLQRLPANKRCADCSAKQPQAVNLAFGTFVCLKCAGVHREFSHRIKGIGHSSFSAEEATFLGSDNAGNEAVNKKYMQKYVAMSEPLKPPGDSADQVKLRYWIRRKYLEKAWIMPEEVETKNKLEQSVTTKKKTKKDKNGKSKPSPTPDSSFNAFENNSTQFDAIFDEVKPKQPAVKPSVEDDFSQLSVNRKTTVPESDPFAQPSAPKSDPFAQPSAPATSAPKSDPFVQPSAPATSTPVSDPFAQPSAPAPASESFADFGQFNTAQPQSTASQNQVPSQQSFGFSNQPSNATQLQDTSPSDTDPNVGSPDSKTMVSSENKSKFDAFDSLSAPIENASFNNNKGGGIKISPQHQYLFQMIQNLNMEQLVTLKQVTEFRLQQMQKQFAQQANPQKQFAQQANPQQQMQNQFAQQNTPQQQMQNQFAQQNNSQQQMQNQFAQQNTPQQQNAQVNPMPSSNFSSLPTQNQFTPAHQMQQFSLPPTAAPPLPKAGPPSSAPPPPPPF